MRSAVYVLACFEKSLLYYWLKNTSETCRGDESRAVKSANLPIKTYPYPPRVDITLNGKSPVEVDRARKMVLSAVRSNANSRRVRARPGR